MEEPEVNRGNNQLDIPEALLKRIHEQHLHLRTIPHFLPSGVDRGEPLSVDQLKELIQTAFWASLCANEGRPTRARVSVFNYFSGAIAFATPIKLDESQIVKLSPAMPSGGRFWFGLRILVSKSLALLVDIPVRGTWMRLPWKLLRRVACKSVLGHFNPLPL